MNFLLKPIAKLRLSWGRTSIQKQLVFIGLTFIAAIVTFTAWIWVSRAQYMINDSVKQFGLALAHALARGGAEALANSGNLDGLKYYILAERGHTPAIAYVVFCDKNGKVLLNPNSEADLKNVYKKYELPVEKLEVPSVTASPPGYRNITNIAVYMKRNQEELGICWVGLENDSFTILGTTKETRFFLISIFGLVALFGAVGVWANYAIINKPLKALSRGASEIAAGRFGFEIPSQRAGNEIDELVNAFNYMSSRLKLYDKHNVDNLMAERNKFISERNKLELVLMSIADGVVVCNRENQVKIVNRAATELFDKDAQDMLGKPLVFCTEGPDAPMICQVIQVFTDSLTPDRVGPIVQQVSLGDKVVRLHSAPIMLNKEFLGSVMIMHDVTKQAELERMKNEFIANVSHELRTPITSIKSYVDTLCNHGDKLEDDIYKEFLQIIDNEADRLMYLVNDVLQLAKLEESDRELEKEPLEIYRACESAVRSVNMMAKDRGIDIVFEPGENIPLADINQESIERVIINLLTNAIKYTPSGGTIKVIIEHLVHPPEKLDTQEGHQDPIKNLEEIAIHIKDTGIGIPEDSLENVFDRFFRVEKKVHTIKGTGLGLTIVKKIIEKHRGRLGVVSALGEGSTFSFYLPVLSFDGIEDEIGELDPALIGADQYPAEEEDDLLEGTISSDREMKRNAFVVPEPSMSDDDERNIPEVSSSDNIAAVNFDAEEDLIESDEEKKDLSDDSKNDDQSNVSGSELAEGATAGESQ